MAQVTVEQIAACGVVGAGGAGFPTHVKLAAQAELIILNAAECEPLLHKDKEMLRAYPDTVLDGLEHARRLVGARAYPLQDGQASDAESIDLSEQVRQRTLRWTPAAGKWRAAVSVAVPELAFQLSDQAADTFIDMLYGEVERRLGSGAMGTTFAGMFQDEHPPTPRDVFTEQLAEHFRRRTGYAIGRAIPALHFDVGPLTPKYRIDYLDTYLALDEACYWI